MERKGKKIFKHHFYDKHTILGAIVLTLLGLLISQTLLGGIGGEIYNFISGTRDYSGVGYNIGLYLGGILGAFIFLALFKRWFYPEYEGGFKGGQNVPRWCILGIAIPVCLLIYYLVTAPASLGIPPLVNWVAALMAGICEESIFRGVTASYLMRQTIGQNKILPTMLVSSILFGLIHGINIIVGAPVFLTFLQILSAFALGLFMCALFLRSGSLIPSMIFHTLYDIVAFTDTSNIGEGGVFKPTATITLQDQIFSMVLRVVYIALAIYLTRPAVRGEIYEIWAKKWNKNADETA